MLVDVAAELRSLGVLPLAVGRPAGFRPLGDLLRDLPAQHARLTEREGDRRAAGAYLAAWIAATPAVAVGLPAILAGVVPAPGPDHLLVHRHREGWLDGYALDVDTLRSPDVDPLHAAAEVITALTLPLVDALADDLPIGAPAIRGFVADSLVGYALWAARAAGDDEERVWRRADGLVGRLAGDLGLRRRPRLFPVAWSGGTTHFHVRASCCLYWRTRSAPGGRAEGTCSTCPLRSDVSRARRLHASLEGAR